MQKRLLGVIYYIFKTKLQPIQINMAVFFSYFVKTGLSRVRYCTLNSRTDHREKKPCGHVYLITLYVIIDNVPMSYTNFLLHSQLPTMVK